MQPFLEHLKNFRGRALILTHQNADCDAIGSAVALKKAMQSFSPRASVAIGAAQGVSKAARRILEELGESVEINPPLDAELLILVDTATLRLLAPLDAELKRSSAKKAVIDHHALNEELHSVADFLIVKDASSTAEVVYELVKKMGTVSDEIALSLLAGIIADTGHLKFATPATLQTVNEILAVKKASYEKALSLLEIPEDVSQKIAHLKAAQRMELFRVMDYVIVTSQVSAFEASAARALVMLGADVAFVGSENKSEIRISARAGEGFLRETNLHLGRDVMPKICGLIAGSGGGHAGAAGAKGKGDLAKALAECVRILQEQVHGSIKKD